MLTALLVLANIGFIVWASLRIRTIVREGQSFTLLSEFLGRYESGVQNLSGPLANLAQQVVDRASHQDETLRRIAASHQETRLDIEELLRRCGGPREKVTP